MSFQSCGADGPTMARTEPLGEGRRNELLAQFGQAALILRTDADVRRTFAAKAVMQDELLAAFLETLTEGITPSPRSQSVARRRSGPPRRGTRRERGRAPAGRRSLLRLRLPRRTLNHAFHQVLGMGPATSGRVCVSIRCDGRCDSPTLPRQAPERHQDRSRPRLLASGPIRFSVPRVVRREPARKARGELTIADQRRTWPYWSRDTRRPLSATACPRLSSAGMP